MTRMVTVGKPWYTLLTEVSFDGSYSIQVQQKFMFFGEQRSDGSQRDSLPNPRIP